MKMIDQEAPIVAPRPKKRKIRNQNSPKFTHKILGLKKIIRQRKVRNSPPSPSSPSLSPSLSPPSPSPPSLIATETKSGIQTSLVDAFICEPIPYRTAIKDNCTHIRKSKIILLLLFFFFINFK